jgi:hypothetical protein
VDKARCGTPATRSLDALGARVPVGDHAFRRQHVDRVVGHALHQQAETLLAGAQRILGLLALGDVAGDLGEAQQRAFLVVDRIDHDVGPEARAVLAHAPGLGLVLALRQGGFQGKLGHAGVLVLGRIEARKMLAQDFLGLVTLETVGAGVPAADAAVRVEHVDGVVADARDQVLVTPVVRQQLFGLRVIVHGVRLDSFTSTIYLSKSS